MAPFKLLLVVVSICLAGEAFVLEGYSYHKLDSLFSCNSPQFRSDSLGLAISRTDLEAKNIFVAVLPTVSGSYNFRSDQDSAGAYEFVVPPGPAVRLSWNLNSIYGDVKARESASLSYQKAVQDHGLRRSAALSDFRVLCISYFTRLKSYRNLVSQVDVLTKIVETKKENLQNNLIKPEDFFSDQLRLLQLQASADLERGEVQKLEVKICSLCGIKYAP